MKEFDHQSDWFFEGQISRKLVAYLITNGYEILKDNSVNVKARGEDIIAIRNGIKEVIEVKGYPSEFYTSDKKKDKKSLQDQDFNQNTGFPKVFLQVSTTIVNI